MRDGVKLHTVILVPKNAKGLPMLLERTPYNASGFAQENIPHLRDALRPAGREWVDDGYILVFQDILGKYGSKGDYVMTRPPIGKLNPSKTDDTTDDPSFAAELPGKQPPLTHAYIAYSLSLLLALEIAAATAYPTSDT